MNVDGIVVICGVEVHSWGADKECYRLSQEDFSDGSEGTDHHQPLPRLNYGKGTGRLQGILESHPNFIMMQLSDVNSIFCRPEYSFPHLLVAPGSQTISVGTGGEG